MAEGDYRVEEGRRLGWRRGDYRVEEEAGMTRVEETGMAEGRRRRGGGWDGGGKEAGVTRLAVV